MAGPGERVERHPCVCGHLYGETRRGTNRHHHRNRGFERLLHELEPGPTADDEDTAREGHRVLEHEVPHNFVAGVVAPDVFVAAEQRPVPVEDPGRMNPTGGLEQLLSETQRIGQRLEQVPIRLDRDDHR